MRFILDRRKEHFYLHEEAVALMLKNIEALNDKVNALLLNPKIQQSIAVISGAISGLPGSGLNLLIILKGSKKFFGDFSSIKENIFYKKNTIYVSSATGHFNITKGVRFSHEKYD